MPTARTLLIDLLRRTLAGGAPTAKELDEDLNPQVLNQHEKQAWEALSHWADDDDIRAKDPSYETFRRAELKEALANLEALEDGYSPQEIEWGEHCARRTSGWGCLVVAAMAVGAYLLLF